MQKILRNRAKCLVCGDIIESTFRHHFVTCSCGNLDVDGGTDYIGRGNRDGWDSYEDMNEYAKFRPQSRFCGRVGERSTQTINGSQRRKNVENRTD